ncbi:TPA: hypothetical protein OUL50_002577 [Clostridioides difficile]|nr:hypothetical protein [Clostridioides difficile]HCU2754854.1 hypothetical protein [Clostridioides difficile]
MKKIDAKKISKNIKESTEFGILYSSLKDKQRDRVLGIMEGMKIANELLENNFMDIKHS